MLTKSYIRKINNLCIYLRDLIGEDKMHAVFSVLNQVCIKNQDRLSKNHDFRIIRNSNVLLKNWLNNLDSKVSKGLVEFSESDLQRRKVIQATLKLVDEFCDFAERTEVLVPQVTFDLIGVEYRMNLVPYEKTHPRRFVFIELTLDRDINKFDPEKENILKSIEKILGIKNVKLIDIREGSVIIRLSLPERDARKLFFLAILGELGELDVIDVKYLDFLTIVDN